MMIVTCWYRLTDDGLKYNHYSQGFDPDATSPPYMFESQRIAWQKVTWQSIIASLVDGRITIERVN